MLSFVGERFLRGLREPERIWAVAPKGFPAPQLPDSADTNISSPQRRLTGRDPDVDLVERLLADRRLVTLVGFGGSGKTRLAVEVALRRRGSFPDGVWFVDLTSVHDPDAVVSTILSTTGAATVGALADRELLVVLDSCEHIVAGAASAAAVLLSASNASRILATSRQPLGLSSEVVSVVGPLAVPTRALRLDDLATSASFALFLDCARSIDASFVVEATDVPALARLLVALEGLPLAIEIAAAQVRTMSLTRLAASVEHELPTLPLPWRDAPERHRSVARTIEWSLGLLESGDREVFEALSVCRGFDVETVAAVTGRSDASPHLSGLVNASLVVSLGGDRFRLLEPVRQHAAHRLAARGAVAAHEERLAHYTLDVVGRLGGRVFRDVEARHRLRLETGNVERSLGWFLEHDRKVEAATMFGSIGVYWHGEDRAALRRWSDRIAPLLADTTPGQSAAARLAIGMLEQGTGDRCAIPELRAAQDGFDASGRHEAAASAAFWLAVELAADARRREETVVAFERALKLAERAGDDVGRNWCLSWLGFLAFEAGDLDTAETRFGGVVRSSVSTDNLHPAGEAVSGLALIALERGDIAKGRLLLDRSVAICRETDDGWQLANLLRRRAFHHLTTGGQLTQTVLDVLESADVYLRIDDEYAIVQTLATAALLCDALGEVTAAATARRSLTMWTLTNEHPRSALIEAARLPADTLHVDEEFTADVESVRDTLRAIVELIARIGE